MAKSTVKSKAGNVHYPDRKEDILILTVGVRGANIMSNPLLVANGIAIIQSKLRDINIDTPITSVSDFVDAFEGLFKET